MTWMTENLHLQLFLLFYSKVKGSLKSLLMKISIKKLKQLKFLLVDIVKDHLSFLGNM